MGIPAASLPWHVGLHHRRADPDVERVERVARRAVQEVGGIPEAADAPLHVLPAGGHEDRARDVEVHPELIERDDRGRRRLSPSAASISGSSSTPKRRGATTAA
jgi:hypothetical protein